MAYNIRPLSFGEILDSAFSVFRDHFALLAGIAVVVGVPIELIALAGVRDRSTVMMLAGILARLIFEPIMIIAFTTAVANLYLDRSMTIGDAYRSVGKVFTPIIGTFLLLDLLIVLCVAALVIPALYFGICWSLMFPVMIVEHRFGMTALRRSRQLVSGVWWRTLAMILVAALISRVPVMALRVIWSNIPLLGPLLSAATLSIAQAYSMVVVVIYYFDRRCRVEDFDLRLLAEQIRIEGAADAATAVQPSPAS